jgi:hypothetical protein
MSHVNGRETTLLKAAADNRKLGNGKGTWTKGAFKGMPLYSLTLEERVTCDHACPVWDLCYGDNMPFATRWDTSVDQGKSLMAVLGNELDILDLKHPAGYSIRLHVLGDFFSMRYIAFWRHALKKHPRLHVYGYTHRTGQLARAIDRVFTQFPTRFVIFQSDPTEETVRPAAMLEGIHPNATSLPLCPEQAGKVPSCLECGLCTSPNIRGVRFAQH